MTDFTTLDPLPGTTAALPAPGADSFAGYERLAAGARAALVTLRADSSDPPRAPGGR